MCFKDSYMNVYSQFTAIQLYSYLQYAITNTIMKVEIKLDLLHTVWYKFIYKPYF